jgi:hypothetical protein
MSEYQLNPIEQAKREKLRLEKPLVYEKIMKIDKPKYVIFLDSPMACQLAANLIKNTK